MVQPILMPLRPVILVEEVLEATPSEFVLVADSYVLGAEKWTAKSWGWETERDGHVIRNVDHHAADPRFYRNVSSGNLALQYLRLHGVDPDAAILINHTDCDSVISSALLAGLLKPEAKYGDAVIAADHTGESNPIADLLQSLDILRDFDCSLRNLRLLEQGSPVEARAEELLEDRARERALASLMVSKGIFQMIGKVAFATLERENRVSGEFLPPLLPNAWAIVSGTPMRSGLWETKVRLGAAAPVGLSLFDLGVLGAEPLFGGRWNAGSTKRAGGSPAPPHEVAARLAELIEVMR